MIKQTCTRRIQFAAGHRVYGHENKCANLHGHNYVVFFEASADKLDGIGRVIDFSVLKEKLGGWIDDNWDHGFLWHAGADIDCAYIFASEAANTLKHFPCSFNPTAEEMARYLLFTVAPAQLEGTNVRVNKVTVWETENCFATAEV